MNTQTMFSEEQISDLVNRFYAKVRRDDEIGPIFNRAVHNWDAHLALLKEFWSTVLHATGRYKGNPLLAHFPLPIEERHFTRWLALFKETANEVMSHEEAAVILHKANLIAANINRILASRRGMAEMETPEGAGASPKTASD